MRLRGFPGCRERWRSAAPANLDQLGELPSKNRSREKACLASGGGVAGDKEPPEQPERGPVTSGHPQAENSLRKSVLTQMR